MSEELNKRIEILEKAVTEIAKGLHSMGFLAESAMGFLLEIESRISDAKQTELQGDKE
jgi:hypothetical protein